MNAEVIKNALENKAKEKIIVYPVNNLSASRLGHPCERYLYLLLTNWEQVKPHDVGLQHIFDLGNSIEDYTIERLKEAGFEVVTPNQDRTGNFKIQVRNGYITGREDLRIKDENGELLPCEIKGLSPYDFDKLNTIEDFFKSKKAHIQGYPTQLFIYLYKFEKQKGFFIITNKLTGEIKPIEVNLDFEFGEKCLSKAERIYDAVAKKQEPEAVEDMAICENCPLAHICGQMHRESVSVEFDGELEELITKRDELKPYLNKYKEFDEEIKSKVGERENVITGKYQILRNIVHRNAYTVPASDYSKLTIKRLWGNYDWNYNFRFAKGQGKS